jgi:hypothetical protein
MYLQKYSENHSNMTEFRANTQKSISFLYIVNELTKFEIKKIQFIIVPLRKETLRNS